MKIWIRTENIDNIMGSDCFMDERGIQIKVLTRKTNIIASLKWIKAFGRDWGQLYTPDLDNVVDGEECEECDTLWYLKSRIGKEISLWEG